jgi:hypothetical protein
MRNWAMAGAACLTLISAASAYADPPPAREWREFPMGRFRPRLAPFARQGHGRRLHDAAPVDPALTATEDFGDR